MSFRRLTWSRRRIIFNPFAPAVTSPRTLCSGSGPKSNLFRSFTASSAEEDLWIRIIPSPDILQPLLCGLMRWSLWCPFIKRQRADSVNFRPVAHQNDTHCSECSLFWRNRSIWFIQGLSATRRLLEASGAVRQAWFMSERHHCPLWRRLPWTHS